MKEYIKLQNSLEATEGDTISFSPKKSSDLPASTKSKTAIQRKFERNLRGMKTSDLENSPLKNLPLEKIPSGSHLDERNEGVHDESDSMALLAGPSDQIKQLVS